MKRVIQDIRDVVLFVPIALRAAVLLCGDNFGDEASNVDGQDVIVSVSSASPPARAIQSPSNAAPLPARRRSLRSFRFRPLRGITLTTVGQS